MGIITERDLLREICSKNLFGQEIDAISVMSTPLLTIDKNSSIEKAAKLMVEYRVRIMMSAFEIQDELFQEYKCVDKFLQKPVLMTDLIDEVRMLVNKMQIPDTNRIS